MKFYVANRTQKLLSRTVEEIVTELLEIKRANGRSRLYLIDLRLRLTRFAKSFRCPIHTVEPADIQRFLDELKMKPRTRNNFAGTMRGFTVRREAGAQSSVPPKGQQATGVIETVRIRSLPEPPHYAEDILPHRAQDLKSQS